MQAIRFPLARDMQRDRPVDPLEAIEFAAQYVTVGASDGGPVRLRTARGSVMEGRIIIDSPAPPIVRAEQIEGHPVDPDLAPVSFVASGNMTRVADGRFRIAALTGPRRVALSGMPGGWYLKTLTVNGSDVTDQVIDFGVGAGRTVAAEVVISTSGGSIVGRVTTARRRTLSGSIVTSSGPACITVTSS